MTPKTKNIIHDESGSLTIDFIFATLMVFAFCSVIFALSFTLSVVEVVQYATFAAARNYYAGHVNENLQKELAERKFIELTGNPGLASLFKNGWFQISEPRIGDFNSEFSEDPGDDSSLFVGVRVSFTAKILEMQFPLLGKTSEDEGGFTANISSFLAREPTSEECIQFNRARFEAIKNLPGTNFSNPAVRPDAYALITDNGC